MHERREVDDLLGRERKRGHPAIWSTGADDGSNQFTLLIVEHELGAQQAWSTVAASCVGAMAERTVRAERDASAFHRRLIFLALRIGPDTSAADPAATGWSRGLRLLRDNQPRACP
jgi:hypothetical protein